VQLLIHDSQASDCQATVMLILVAKEPLRTGFIKHEVEERFMVPHHLTAFHVQHSVQSAHNIVSIANGERCFASVACRVEDPNGG
jgi:hypothetical protein